MWYSSQEIKHLGHFLTDDLNDDRDIYWQCCKLYAQANMLLRKFSMCSVNVKCSLFRALCTPMYTAHLRCCYRKSSMWRLIVAYNDAVRLLLQIPRWHSASQLFVFSGVPTCEALLRHLMYNFMCHLYESEYSIIEALTNPRKSCSQYSFRQRKHWQDSLHMNVFFLDWMMNCCGFILCVLFSSFVFIAMDPLGSLK